MPPPAAPEPTLSVSVSAAAPPPGPELIWRSIGSHEARLDQLESGAADTRHELKEVRAEVQAVQAHLLQQDTSIGDIAGGIAELRSAARTRGDEHKATLHAIKLTIVSVALSSFFGLALAAAEHALIH